MNKELAIKVWNRRKIIAEVTTTTFVIGKGIVDFVRKDGIGKVVALAELAIGIGAAAIHTGAADKIVATVAERAAEEDYQGYDPYEGLSHEGPDPYDSEYDDYDHDEEDYDDDADEDGFDPNEFNEFVSSGECPEYAEEEDAIDVDGEEE